MRVLFLACLSPKTGNCTTAERIRYSIAVFIMKPGSITDLSLFLDVTIQAYFSGMRLVRRSRDMSIGLPCSTLHIHTVTLCHVLHVNEMHSNVVL